MLPTIKKNFNARRTLHAAIDTVRAINKLREAQNLMMDGAKSKEPERGNAGPRGAPAVRKDDSAISMSGGATGAQNRDSGYGTASTDVTMGGTGRASDTSKGLWSPGSRR